jgi:hypothetical protein
MKNLLLYLFAFTFSSSSLVAQDSLILNSKSPIGDESFKFVFPNNQQSFCEANCLFLSILDDDYVALSVKSCKKKAKNTYQINLFDQVNTKYKAKYSPKAGLSLSNTKGAVRIFGKATTFISKENSITIIDAGKNTYFSLLLPKRSVHDEILFLTSKKELKHFSEKFSLFLANKIAVIEFEVRPQLKIDKDKGRVKFSKKEESIIIEFIYKNETFVLTTDK